MDLQSFGIAVISIAAMLGIIVVALRLTRRSYDRFRERVSRVEAAFTEVAEKTGLVVRRLEAHEHPVVGTIPTFPKLGGEWRGYRITIEVEVDSAGEGGAMCQTRIVVRRLKGGPWPSPGKLERADREDRIPLAAVPGLRAIETRVRRVSIEMGEIRVEARGDRTGSGMSFAYDLLLDPGKTVALLDDLVAFANAL